MLVAIAGAVATGVTIASGTGDAARTACGKERWAAKTLQDDAGRALDLSKIVKTTVPALRSLPVQRGPSGSRGEAIAGESLIGESPTYRLVPGARRRDSRLLRRRSDREHHVASDGR